MLGLTSSLTETFFFKPGPAFTPVAKDDCAGTFPVTPGFVLATENKNISYATYSILNTCR